ncbi:MAG: hypothetical protein CVU68_00640 [Deltaproteobacteria bacterium HGW-Deltaproteobacteria-3]|nr:MAG: hypothetical protein CVU68_00640 [Deltaproteobacteria bacterium HGW-Deltaproteobacteria-3]
MKKNVSVFYLISLMFLYPASSIAGTNLKPEALACSSEKTIQGLTLPATKKDREGVRMALIKLQIGMGECSILETTTNTPIKIQKSGKSNGENYYGFIFDDPAGGGVVYWTLAANVVNTTSQTGKFKTIPGKYPVHESSYDSYHAECLGGEKVFVNVQHNNKNIYSWGGGKTAGTEAGIGVESALRKACGGRD